MPIRSTAFEFYLPWLTRNSHIPQVQFTKPQTLMGWSPPPYMEIKSNKIQGAAYFGYDVRTYTVTYSVEGAFRGRCHIEGSIEPNPSENDWFCIDGSQTMFTGFETTGSAGMSGGYNGSVSHPTQTNVVQFTGLYAWIRAVASVGQGTLHSIRINW